MRAAHPHVMIVKWESNGAGRQLKQPTGPGRSGEGIVSSAECLMVYCNRGLTSGDAADR